MDVSIENVSIGEYKITSNPNIVIATNLDSACMGLGVVERRVHRERMRGLACVSLEKGQIDLLVNRFLSDGRFEGTRIVPFLGYVPDSWQTDYTELSPTARYFVELLREKGLEIDAESIESRHLSDSEEGIQRKRMVMRWDELRVVHLSNRGVVLPFEREKGGFVYYTSIAYPKSPLREIGEVIALQRRKSFVLS